MSLALVFVTCALYWPARHFDFVEYDDPEYVAENPAVRNGITSDGLAWSVVDAHAANWHPVTWISHMLDCQLFGVQPGAHHLVNALLHAVNTALLFLLLRRMTGAFWRSALVAGLFAWHPLRVESVAWISERKDVLSGCFFLLTLWAYVKYVTWSRKIAHSQPSGSTLGAVEVQATTFSSQECKQARSSYWYHLTLIFFVLGLFAKPMLISVPLVLLLLDYWPLCRFADSEGFLWCGLRIPTGLLREKLPFVALAAVLGLITVLAQKSGGAVVSFQNEGLLTRLATMFAGYFGYLEKIFWPHDLACLYLRPQSVPVLSALAGISIVAGMSTAAVAVRQRPYFVVGWIWFVGMMLPVSGLVQTGLQSMADRYTYLPTIGLGIMVVWGVTDLTANRMTAKSGRILLAAAGGAILLACACLTHQQLGYWTNTETLMDHALQIDPSNYVAHQNLARYFSKIGQAEIASAHRQKVRELDPALAAK